MLTPTAAIDVLRRLPSGTEVLDVVARTPGAWVVGGAVRDALLGREPRELDLMIDGDPAQLIAGLGGSVVAHERFGTATVTLPGRGPDGDPVTVDVARARRERYAVPGALPDVEPAPAAEDLRRRDVTVNAIALRPAVAGGDAPELLAVDGALDDLRAGVLRVLHDRSFADDPTRLWRIARYAARLGFTVDPHTAQLAARADPRSVSGGRLGNELRLALREPDPLAALRGAAALSDGLLVAGLDLEPAQLESTLALLDGIADVPVRRDLVTLAACCRGTDAGALVDWLSALGLGPGELDIVAAGSRASTYSPLRRAQTPSQIARAASGAPLEVVALAGGDQARRWLEELRHVRLQITGADLLAAGVPQGPELGRRLQAALDARLDGLIDAGRDAELAVALAADVAAVRP
ncbi:A-adding tRNA nucleotidyltransferase [Paraconexibacter sp. AEG42_29]|uniref:A-adding tRNA nucleotidyltransferase n=1 Tax=Paraconexibacter sp. AEG42_29 TaxID=2997339 RepID=A0AAU7AV27_9ACTN